jgi:hypothetical protein
MATRKPKPRVEVLYIGDSPNGECSGITSYCKSQKIPISLTRKRSFRQYIPHGQSYNRNAMVFVNNGEGLTPSAAIGVLSGIMRQKSGLETTATAE